MSPKSSGFVRPVETTSSRWDEATARFLSVFHQTPNTLKKSNGSAARKRTRSRANGRGLSARLESGRAQSAAGPRQKSAGQRPISSRIAHQRVLLRSAASNTSSTNRKIASAQASSRPPSGLRALSFLLVNHSRKPRTLVGGNWKNKGNVVKWSGLAPQSREISLDAPHKERLPIDTQNSVMTREMKECLQSLTRECASPDLFREQSHSLASEAATQVKKQWDAHLKQSEKQNLHSHLAISSTKNANNNAKNAHRVRDPVKFPFGLAESEVKIRIPSEFSKHRILPNIASEGLQEAKKNLMLKYNKAPKNQLQVPLKRLTPVARVGGSGARIEDQVSIQQNNSSNEQTISQLLSIEKDAQESPHQEIIDSAALWEDVDELEKTDIELPYSQAKAPSVFPLDYFMDGEDIQILVSRVAESKGYLCWALENSTDDSARDLQCIWKSVKLLTYDDADRSFLAESEDEEKPQWIPYSEIRRHEQTDSRFLSSIQSARTLRKEFEHHLTLEYAAKSMLPSLQNLVSVFPQTEIAQVFRGCEKSLRIKNKENSSFSSDILLQELSRELEAEYLSAQVKSALTWKTHFSTFLKKVEKRHGLCLPQENIRAPLRNFDNSIHVSSPLNTADLVRVQNPVVQEAMIQLKTQLTTLLRPSILSTFEFAIVSGTLHNRKLRDGLDVRIDPADGHISITFDAFLQATEVFQSEFKDTIRVQVPNITKQIALSLNQCPGINGPKMVTVMAISVLIPLIRAKIMETYRLFEANKLRVRLNTMLYQDNNQPTHKNQSRFGNFQVAFDNDLAAQYEVLETCFLGWLEDIECQLPAETFHSSPSDVGFLETLFTDTMTDSVSLTMDLLSDARSTFAEYILRLRRVEAENLDVQTYLDNRQTQLNILDSLEKYATIRSPILRRGIFEVTFDVLLASIGQVVGMGRLILQEQCSDYLVSNIESLNARFAEYLKLPEPVTFEQTKNASNALKTISNSIPNIEAKIYSNFQIFVFVHEHSWLLDDLVVEDLFAATQSLVQLGAFIELRSTQVKAAFDKLRNNIGREIEMFMSLWTGVESAMTKLFTQQPKQAHEKEITENMASKAKEKRSTIDSLPTDLSTEESVMAALNYIIRHISNAADIANVISKKIDVLDNVPRTEEMRQIWSFMKSRNVLVQTLMKTRQKLRDWRTKPILTVDVGECERESKAYLQVLTDTDLIKSFLVQSSRKTLQDFVQKEIPMIQELKNSIFQEWHWDTIRQKLGIGFHPTVNCIKNVTDVLKDGQFESFMETIRGVEKAANKEKDTITTMSEISSRYANLSIQVDKHGNARFLVAHPFDALFSTIDSDLLAIRTLQTSQGMEKFMSLFRDLESKLEVAQSVLGQWENIQKTVISVYKFFESEEVRLELSGELKRFKLIEAAYRSIISNAQRHQKLAKMIELAPDLPNSLDEMLQGLKSLIVDVQGWLDNKRVAFPRLFFVSDEELLELVSGSKQPQKVKHILQRVFSFVDLKCSESPIKGIQITDIISGHDERVSLSSPVDTKGFSADKWMARLDSEIRETLTADFKKTYKYIENANYSSGALWKEIYENLPFEIPGQICLALARSQRCNIMETVIVRNPRALKVILDQIKENLKSLSKRLYSADYQARLHQGNLTQFVMFELESRDWLQDLTKKNVCSLKDYDWLKGLRYQCEDISKDLHVKQFLYKLPYGFEYLGFDYGSPTGIFPEAIFHNIWVASASKLGFLTHSDDMQYQKEAFRTYSNALGYRMFNVRCTRFVNPKVLSRALLGIAVSGCFAHLENVNLLDGESLDFLSQSITNLREIAGKKEGLNVSFLGRVIRIPGRIRFPVFVSTSKDFAQDDRNLGFLKTTMRSMELFSVEPTTYCQYLLFLSGYVRYFDLGKKLSRVFSDIPSLLSGIRFYDFSISAMRTIILMSTKKREHVENTGSNSNEEYLLRALFLYYLPRLHKSDKDPFISALANIFGIELSDDFISYGNSDRETLLIQMVQHELNVVVLGDAGVGKTTLLRAVAKDLGAEFRSVSAAAVGKDMVLGLYESSSYVPGILENISNSQHSLIFLVFDGPIESWCSEVIDAFLGDGCIVPNGKQLSLTSKLRVIWETQDFSNADPRIFGNFGMIHINTKIAWSDITKLWVENIKIQGSFHPLYRLTDKILAIFEHYTSEVYTVTKEMRKNLPIKTLVSSALSLFEAIYTENVTKMAEPNTLHSVIQYALLCTFCPIISGADQKGFEIHFADLVKQLDPYGPLTQFLETNPSCRLHRLELDISHMVWKLSLPGSTSWWETCAQYLIKAKIPVLLTGPIGSRKTTTLTKIKAQMEEDFLCYTESMLPGSNPRKIGEYFNRILVPDENGSRYIPANNKNLITFLDDVNIAQPSTGEDYCMWEFIRGVIGTGAYWANATSCRHIENIGMICSVDTNHKGQILVPKNLERHFTFISTGTLDDAVELVLHFVSTEIAGKLASRFKGDLSQCLLNITNVLKDLSIGLRAWSVSEATSAYSLFSVHDLERVFSGIMDCDSFGLWDHNKLISLFVHECQRVFRDRLPRDQGYHFDNLFNLSFGRHLPRRDTLFDEDFLIRVSRFINEICVEDESNSSPKVLKYTKDIIPVDKDTLEKIIIETSRKYSDKKRLYNYPTAALHFNRLHRILNLENYCRALLIGFPGIDYVLDMVMLVANYCNFPLRKYQFSSKKFSVSDWNSFIKRQIMDSTIYNHVVVANVIVTKDAVVPMLVWGDLHSICNHGRVDRLWSESEFEELLNKMLAELKRTDPEFDPGNDPRPLVMKGVFEKFKVRISSNLKIVICIDQRNTLCIQSTSRFPRMIAQFHTDIYEEYEQDDWTALASNILQESSLSLGETEILSIGRTCAKAFSFAISVGRDMGFMEHMLNSHHYQALLDQFASDYGRFTSDWSKKKISLTSSRATIENEIGSLDQERVQVHEKLLELPSKIREISNEIAMHRDLLSQKETEFNTLEKILKDKESAYVRTMYEKEEATLKAAFLQAKEQLEQSVQFLHTIRKNDIDDLKAYTTPPQAVCLLADALCIIFDCPAGWQNAKRLLISNTFMSKILAVDREALPIYKIERLKRYSEMPNFHTDKMLNISVAARALCQWVKTLTNFAWIAGQMSSSEQIASRVRKVGIAKLSKTEEKFRYDQLALEKDTLSRAIRKLAALQRQEIGRLSILKEIIKPDSIFDRVNDEGYNESISQWIQQAFQCLDTGVTFDSLEVSQAHTTYLEAVKYLETVQLSLANESKRCEEIMREVKESLYSLTKDQIQEMVREKAQNPYSEQGMNIILFILGLHSQSLVEDIHLKIRNHDVEKAALSGTKHLRELMDHVLFQKSVFYDSKFVTSSARTAHQPPRGALIAKEVAEKMLAFADLSEQIKARKVKVSQNVISKKNVFDHKWSEKYSDESEFWTFEFIIQTFKNVREVLMLLPPNEIVHELSANRPGLFIQKTLRTACALIGENGDTPLEFIRQNPSTFCIRLSQVKLGDDSNCHIVQSIIGDVAERIEPLIIQEYSRIYVDILGLLPLQVVFRILIKLDDKALGMIPMVSRRWAQMLAPNQLWKLLSHYRGWGIIFTPPKIFEWRKFYRRMALTCRRRLGAYQQSYDKEVHGIMGLKAYKKHSTFLKKVPEYSHAERQLNDSVTEIVNLEIANLLFLQLEDKFTAFLENEALLAGHRIQTAKQAIQKNISLRYRILRINCITNSKIVLYDKPVHELLVDKARKRNCVHATVERLRKQNQAGKVTATIVVEWHFGPTKQNETQMDKGAPRSSIILIVAKFIKLVAAYGKGIQMGKKYQYHVMTRTALSSLLMSLSARIQTLEEQKPFLVGSCLLTSLRTAVLPCFPPSHHAVMVEYWADLIKLSFPIAPGRVNFQNWVPDVSFKLSETEKAPAFANAVHAATNASLRTICFDPLGLFSQFLSANSFSYAESPGDDNEWETDWDYTKTLTQKIAIGVSPSSYSDILNMLASLKISFTSHLDVITRLNAPIFAINLSEEWVTLRGVILDALNKKIQLPSTQSRRDLVRSLDRQRDDIEAVSLTLCNMLQATQLNDEIRHDIILFSRKCTSFEDQLQLLSKMDQDFSSVKDKIDSFAQVISDIFEELNGLCRWDTLYLLNPKDLLNMLLSNTQFVDCTSQEEAFHFIDEHMNSWIKVILCQVANHLTKYDTLIFGVLVSLGLQSFRGRLSRTSYAIARDFIASNRSPEAKISFYELLKLRLGREFNQFGAALLGSHIGDPENEKLIGRLSRYEKHLLQVFCEPSVSVRRLMDLILVTGLQAPVRAIDPRIWVKELSEQNTSAFLMVTKRPSSIEIAVRSTFDVLDTTHVQILTLCDDDKQGNKWREKIAVAKKSGDWLVANLDKFWIGHLEALYVIANHDIAPDFKLWLICPDFLQNLIPLEMYGKFSSNFDIIGDNPHDNLNDFLQSLAIPPVSLRDAHISTLYGTFLGAHFVLIKLFRRLQASYHFDESDGDELFKILLDASRKKLPSSTVMSLLTSSIYGGLCPTSWSKKWVVGLLDEAEKQYLEALKTSSASKDRVSLSQFIAAVRDVETSLHKRSEKYQIQDWLDRLSSLFRSTTDDMLVKDINDQLSQFANTYFNIPDWRSASESPTITTSIRFYGSLKRAMAEFDSSKMVCKAMIMKAFQSSSIWESCWKNEKDSTGYSNSLQKLQTVSLRFMEWMLSETQKDTLICTNIIDAIILNMFDFAFQQNVPVDHVVVISPPTNKGTLSILGPDFYSAIPEYTNRTREFFSNISRIDMGLQISTESSIAEKLEIKLPGVPINAKSVPITNSSCLGMTRMSVEISGLELTDSRFVDGAFIQTKPEMIKHQTGRNRRKNALVAPPNDFIVYVSSTPDAFIERNLLTVAIMPHLKRTLCSLGLRLQIVDLQRKLDSCSREDYLHSAKFWIERSSLCIIFFGGTIMCGKVMDKSGLPDNVVESEIGMILRLGTSTITLIRDNAFVRSVPRSYKRRFETEETMELDKVSTLRQAVFSMVGGNPKTYTFSFSHIEDQDLVMRNTEELQEIVTQLVSDKVNLYAARTELRCPQQFSGTLLPSRNSALQKIKRLILENRDGGSGLFLITGTSGVGKTALLSTLVQEVQPEFIVLDSFAGSWNGSHRITQVLQKFVYLLQIHLRNDKVAPILRDGEIHSHYLDLLRRTVFLGHKIIIVIDAAEEISFEADSHAHWLPKLQELDRETWRNIRWIVSSENSRITEEIQRRGIRHHHTRLDTISEVEKMQLFDTLQAHENTDLLQRMRNSPDANLPFFTTLCNHVFGLMMTGESLPSSAIDIDTLLTWWIKSMERLHGQALVRDLFSLIEVARDGLSHEDLVELLSISTIRLSKMVSQTQALIQVSSSGQLHYSTSKVRTVIRRRYLEDEAYVSGLHRQIASHFSFICDPYNNKSWMGYYEFRSADIIHHWLLTGRNLQDTVDTLCSLPFLESCFKNRSDHELIKFFTMAMKESAALDEQNHFKRLNEYSSFIQKHSATLRRTTACITSLALSHSVSGQMIYEDALASKKLWSEQAVIGCMTPLGDNLNTVSMGKHNSNVIYVGAFQLKSLGKCCITVSDDGAVKAWDLDSFLCVGDVLEAPYPPGHIIKCAFSLTGTDRVILANAKGSICMHDLETKELLLGLEYAYKNGAIFFSDDNHGFWQQNTEGTVIFTPFQNHLETMRLSDSSLCLSGSQTSTLGQKFEMNAFLAQSNDGAKIAVLSSKYGGLLVLNAHKMSEICRFKDPLVSAKSIGQFSVSKDLLALTLDSGNIMIWRIDNHSRVSLLNTAEVKVQSLAFSSDETLLYVGTSDGDLLIMDILTGVITKKIALDTGKSRILMCVTTSYGKERFFFAAEQSVMMSDVKQTISYSTSAAIVEFEEPGSASVRQLFLADSGEYNVVSLLSTGELCFWSKNDVVKRLALREGSHLETSGFHSASGIFVYLAQGYLVIFSLKDEREILRRAMDRIVKEVRIETFCQKEGDSLFVALLTISEELLGYILTESCGTWSLKQILERKKVTIVPRTPLQAGTDRLLIGSVDKTIVINIKTGKQVFERRSLSDEKIKDLMWFNPEDPQGMGDQIAFLTEDSLHAGDEVWSSGLPFAVPLILENFDFCQEIGRLAYLGTQTIEVLDHTLGTLRPHSYSVLNVIQTLPSRKRLGSLDHDKAQISKWCILPTRRHLLSLTATGVMRVWDMESLELLGALPLPGTFRTREMRVSFSGQEPLIYLTDGTKILVFRLWLPVPMVQS